MQVIWDGDRCPPGVNRMKTLPSVVLRTREVIIARAVTLWLTEEGLQSYILLFYYDTRHSSFLSPKILQLVSRFSCILLDVSEVVDLNWVSE